MKKYSIYNCVTKKVIFKTNSLFHASLRQRREQEKHGKHWNSVYIRYN